MKGKEEKIAEYYELEVLGSRRGRGTFICETVEGVKVWKPVKGGSGKIAALNSMLHKIKESTRLVVETYLAGKEEKWIYENEEGEPCALKDYLDGKEWNLEEEQELFRGTEILGQLHKFLREMDCGEEKEKLPVVPSWAEEVEKRNREIKRTRNFMRGQKRKTAFELFFLKVYPVFEKESVDVAEKLVEYDYEKLKRDAISRGGICHGDFTYHNLIHHQGKTAILNFESAYRGIQVDDLYHFLRKSLEKNHWSYVLFERALECYERYNVLTREEWEYLYLRFAYPEKYWKIANHYANSRKTRIPEKDMKKLETLILQQEEKNAFLQMMEKKMLEERIG